MRREISFLLNPKASMDSLSDPQKHKLRRALILGRRKISVKDLSNELKVDRSVLLDWFKQYSQDPAAISSRLSTPLDALPDDNQDKESNDQEALKKRQKKLSYWERRRLGLDKKRISAAANRTMSMIYQKTKWPDETTVNSVCVAHKLRKNQVVNWFKEKREEDGQ
eukprot:CAMPEP_0167750624 /NCGR_PEP_ID=MMETSP0110_2-20121227/6098_1 /TAXON_ID=629695 /ORGANISM="Gymnochlora sp., Strain CCMP2014" /LENGTH=165 /DNA_ID=CAMNT_0007635973 /DNA_START=329 /DNA_END=826 /DNA_ORIENTATION=+